jgi:hypothetical protein
MTLNRLGSGGSRLGLTPLGGANAASGAPFPAPAGFRWEFLLDDTTNQRVLDDATNQPLIDLVPA